MSEDPLEYTGPPLVGNCEWCDWPHFDAEKLAKHRPSCPDRPDDTREHIKQAAERTACISAGLNERLADGDTREHDTACHRNGLGCICPADDTRDQLAAAMYDTYGQQDRHRSNAIADAASAVADEEQGCGCESHTSNEECVGPVWMALQGLRDENARLRAAKEFSDQKCDEYRAERDQTDRRVQQAAETRMRESAELRAAIERVEAVAEDWGSHRDAGDLANSIFNALEGEPS